MTEDFKPFTERITLPFLQRWTEVLRSGEYEQGRGSLRTRSTSGEDTYCCWGVFLDLLDPDGWTGRVPIKDEDDQNMEIFLHRLAASDEQGNYYQTKMPDRELQHAVARFGPKAVELAERNDDGETFTDIADHIDYYIG